MDQFLACESGESLSGFAHRCIDSDTPGLVELRPYADDRGWSFMGLMAGVLDGGQVNYSVQYTGVIKAWHRHAHQMDYWTVVRGMMKACVMSHDGQRRWAIEMGEMRPRLLLVPAGLWHGAKTLSGGDASLLYYVTKEYDAANPDDERAAHDWQWNPWDTVPR